MSNDLEIPSWMNKQYFEKILNHELNEIQFESASKPGDGFASTIFRVICKSDKNISLIIKMAPIEEGFKKQLMIQEMAFSVEIKMYTEVLPKMDEVLRTVLGTDVKIGPKLLHHGLSPTPLLVMEDLIPRGFERSKTTFGFYESRLIIQRLGQFHASSVVVNETGYDLTNMKNSWFHTDRQRTDFSVTKDYVLPSLRLFIKAAEGFQYDVKVMERLKDFEENFLKYLEDVYIETNNKQYFALCHADFHRKNMLFRWQGGDEETLPEFDFALFDYPLCVWATPVIDLIYFFYQVCSEETRKKYRMALLKYYFEAYRKVLTKFNCTASYTLTCLHSLKGELWKQRAAEVMHIALFYKFQFANFTKEETETNPDQNLLTMMEAITYKKEFQEAAKVEIEHLLSVDL